MILEAIKKTRKGNKEREQIITETLEKLQVLKIKSRTIGKKKQKRKKRIKSIQSFQF